jgi:serine/threonine protein kinase
MASTSQLSTWPVITTSVDTSTTRPTYSPALNLLAAVATADIREYTLIEIGIRNMDNDHSMDKRQVGRGGFAVVELGNTDENRIVAVKRMRISGKDAQADFGNHLRHLCLELQILCHEPLKGHPNIINILGYCLSEIVGFEVPFLALVLEYSSEGTLKAFLCDNQYSLTITTLVDLAAQVAAGLEALHQCNICHGDIKTQNALVFRNEDTWTVKLSDFGGSVVGRSDDPSLPVERGFGTRLMNAPEIRSDMARTNAHFTIDDAIRTDVFSFGLLTWEVLKQGSSYCDKEWCAEVEGIIDVDEMEEYLEKLPHNGLLSKACDYVKSNLCGNETLELMLWTFQNSLQDDPTKRCSMKEIRERLESQNPPIL